MTKFILVLITSGACFVACANAPAAQTTGAPANAASTSAEQAAREELVRRQEAQLRAEKLMAEGEKLYYAGKYADAAAKLEEALRLVPRAPATEIDHDRAVRGLTDCYLHLADGALHDGDYVKARQYAQRVLADDPQSRDAEDIIVKSKREEAVGAKPSVPTPPALDATPEFVAKKDQIKKLFREGKILMNSGQYDEARKRFEAVLLIDPYNEDAATLLKSVDEARMEIAHGAQDESRAQRLLEVADSWTPPIAREVQRPPVSLAEGPIGSEAVRLQKIKEKLNKIIIPEINYREAVVSDVITFLSEESRRLDVPDHVGVNIVLSGGLGTPSPATPAGAPALPPAAPAPGTPEAGTPAAPGAGAGEGVEGRKITLSLRNVPMIDALKYVTQLAGLKYLVEPSTVIVLPLEAPEGQMVTKMYRITAGVFIPGVVITNNPAPTQTTQSAGGGGGGVTASTPLIPVDASTVLPTVYFAVQTNDLKRLFIDAGVPFPAGSSLIYHEHSSTLIVHNTPENLETLEAVLDVLNSTPPEVEIEAKFVEINQNDLDELGFDWQMGTKTLGSFDVTGGNAVGGFPPGTAANGTQSSDITGGLRDSTAIQGNAIDSLLAANGFGTVSTPADQIATIRGILTNPQFQVTIKALSQKQSTDILSAPKVVTTSGGQAQIRVAQEFIYPTTFSQPTATAAGGGTTGGGAAAVTPSIPSGFASRSVGVVFNVSPVVGADGYTINLTLIPQVTSFLGFINYGGPISLAAGNNVVTTFNDIKQPLFSTQDIITSVVVYDGQTVVLGGLVTEQYNKIDDKTPFLGDIPVVGRLFRSKTTQRAKQNLLIFVTARLIDPAGNPVHRMPLTASAR